MDEHKTLTRPSGRRGPRRPAIWLNRPEVHNAFNAVMIRELRDALRTPRRGRPAVRVVVLSGEGNSFCAGADLNWMREIVRYSYEQNLAGIARSRRVSCTTLRRCPSRRSPASTAPAIGGGAGFLSACDIVVASTDGAASA